MLFCATTETKVEKVPEDTREPKAKIKITLEMEIARARQRMANKRIIETYVEDHFSLMSKSKQFIYKNAKKSSKPKGSKKPNGLSKPNGSSKPKKLNNSFSWMSQVDDTNQENFFWMFRQNLKEAVVQYIMNYIQEINSGELYYSDKCDPSLLNPILLKRASLAKYKRLHIKWSYEKFLSSVGSLCWYGFHVVPYPKKFKKLKNFEDNPFFFFRVDAAGEYALSTRPGELSWHNYKPNEENHKIQLEQIFPVGKRWEENRRKRCEENKKLEEMELKLAEQIRSAVPRPRTDVIREDNQLVLSNDREQIRVAEQINTEIKNTQSNSKAKKKEKSEKELVEKEPKKPVERIEAKRLESGQRNTGYSIGIILILTILLCVFFSKSRMFYE